VRKQGTQIAGSVINPHFSSCWPGLAIPGFSAFAELSRINKFNTF
jgi:hypothetical protein